MSYEQFVNELTDEDKAMIDYEGMTLREYYDLQIAITERLSY